MGVRAHRINSYKPAETFSLGEERVWEMIEENSGDLGLSSIQLDMSGCGMVSMDISVAELIAKDPEVEEGTRSSFVTDIKWAKKNDESWLKYYCY